jgi:hypothetical protein
MINFSINVVATIFAVCTTILWVILRILNVLMDLVIERT